MRDSSFRKTILAASRAKRSRERRGRETSGDGGDVTLIRDSVQVPAVTYPSPYRSTDIT